MSCSFSLASLVRQSRGAVAAVCACVCVCVCVGAGVLALLDHSGGEGKRESQMEPVDLGGTPKFAV